MLPQRTGNWRNYFHEIPTLFAYNAICVMSDMTTSKAGTITSGEDRFMEWKTKDGSYENTQYAAFDTFFEGRFEKERFLDILKNFICFNVDGQNTFKILAAYHQYFAVKKAVSSTLTASVGQWERRCLLAYSGKREIPLDGFLCSCLARGDGKPDHSCADRQKRP